VCGWRGQLSSGDMGFGVDKGNDHDADARD
jgi:hypothetical protein